MIILEEFPTSETAAELGGESDGNVFTTAFTGASLAATFNLVRQFLHEHGYKDIPLPADEKELAMFRLATRNKQILMFEDNGYIHNPVKILFHPDRRKKNTLTLKIYNVKAPGHLLRFHGRLPESS